ncbi:DUF885 domain-containing protein [Timonella senegalensis]|uniref:DUF885 domain-containing protein n=2 Tax=Timonella senegalensis TaxID=1465825 RepID=UPI002FDEE7DE
MTSLSREASAVDAIAEDYMTKLAALDPFGATAIGIPGYDHLVTDLSPAGLSARAELDRATLSALDSVDPTDEIDAVSIAAMRERLGLAVETFESGWAHADLNNIASPLQGMRDLFDLQPVATVQDWENIASRLSLLPTSIAGYIESLRFGAASGKVPAKLQVTLGAAEARENANEDETFFLKFVTSDDATKIIETSENAADLGARLKDAALATARAYGELADFLETELLPQAPEKDAAGRERYELASREFLGATIDLDETYEWGLAELARIVAEQQAIAEELYGAGTTVEQAVENLDKDDRYILRSKDELKAWMQETADKAIRELNGVHFDIPDPVQTIECMIAPTQTGGIYYTPPTDDFSRAGRMWWSVPPSVTTFNTWREKTTVFHEGVPGHHLQCAQAVYLRDTLNSWRRLACWVSGHGEGWALYSERLMEDLGYLEDPADRLGMLDGQRLRAARVVLDIGVHLEKPCPEEWGGGIWDSEKAWEFLKANVNMPEAFVRFELNRYLGWPGQAPSYKVGQRLWEQIREDARAAAEARGEEFSLKDFHERALALGSVGLDVLGEALAG